LRPIVLCRRKERAQHEARGSGSTRVSKGAAKEPRLPQHQPHAPSPRCALPTAGAVNNMPCVFGTICLRGDLPPVLLRAVIFVRAIVLCALPAAGAVNDMPCVSRVCVRCASLCTHCVR
jgi:hypothetical protein